MQGTIIHYDELTRCGLLREESGQTRFFRREELPENAVVADNLTVRVDVRREEGEERGGMMGSSPTPEVQTRPMPVSRVNWPGTLISVSALVALILSGNEPGGLRGGRTPSLLGSVWGVVAALLLVAETSWFVIGARRWLVRLGFWPIAFCSAMAFWMQSCDGFEGDTASDVYLYLLAALFVAAYLLPYRRKNEP